MAKVNRDLTHFISQPETRVSHRLSVVAITNMLPTILTLVALLLVNADAAPSRLVFIVKTNVVSSPVLNTI